MACELLEVSCYQRYRMKSLRAFRTSSDLPIQRRLKGHAGKFLMKLKPELSAAVRASPFSTSWSQSGKLIRNALLIRAIETHDHAMICEFLRDYWSSSVSDEFYDGFAHRYETVFLAHHQGIVAEVAKVIEKTGAEINQVIEIGAGDGKILEHFSNHLEGIPIFKGMDINAAQMENNRIKHAESPRLSFHQGDASAWLAAETRPGTLLLSNGGVLEYFTREDVRKMFQNLGTNGAPCLVVLTESIATDHDLKNESETYPYGFELSLSHNYEALLKEAGFSIGFMKDRLTTPEESEIVGRWIQIVAVRMK